MDNTWNPPGLYNGMPLSAEIQYDEFDYAFLIDQEINIIKSKLTPEQAADKHIPPEWRERAIAEYKRWQERKNK